MRWRSHGAAGNVDRRLAAFILITAIAGIQLAVWINVHLLKSTGDSHGAGGSAAANLYISLVFVCILSVVAISMLKDALVATVMTQVGRRGGSPIFWRVSICRRSFTFGWPTPRSVCGF